MFADFKVIALSEQGACLEMDTPLAIDSQCDISLNLAHVTVDLRGKVVNVEQPGDGTVFHVGITFVKVEALDRALLESFLDRERQRAGA